jgi:hypothetical protein
MQVCFDSPELLRGEFEKNITNRGIFVPTEAQFEIRQRVVVDIVLGYVEAGAASLSLEGEVLHRIGPEMTVGGAVPGVAVQFEASALDLAEMFAPLLGQETVPAPRADTQGAARRSARREPVRVPVRVEPTSSPPFEASSRDLSLTGILFSVRDIVPPVGERVRICIFHPGGAPCIELDGQVARQIKNETGRIAAVAVAFDENQAADPHVCEVIDSLCHAANHSRLGGISGSIADLGLVKLLQMFGSSAPCGTLVVDYDGEQGWVAFADGSLLGAELGALKDHDAIVAMLEWPDGHFEFEAVADELLVDMAERHPLAAAILEAERASGQRNAGGRASRRGASAEETIVLEPGDVHIPCLQFGPDTILDVDSEIEEQLGSVLGKLEQAVFDLASSAMPLGKIVEIIPEAEERIHVVVEGLIESGLLRPR